MTSTPTLGRKPGSLPPLELRSPRGKSRPIPLLITDGIGTPLPPPSPGFLSDVMDTYTPRSLTPTSPCPAIKVQVDTGHPMDSGQQLPDDANDQSQGLSPRSPLSPLSPRIRCHSDAGNFTKRFPEKQRLEQDSGLIPRPLSMDRLDLLRMEPGASLSPPMSPREKNLRHGITPRGRPIRLEPLTPRPSTPDMHRDPRPDGRDIETPVESSSQASSPEPEAPDNQI
jgi:hypothetical protein